MRYLGIFKSETRPMTTGQSSIDKLHLDFFKNFGQGAGAGAEPASPNHSVQGRSHLQKQSNILMFEVLLKCLECMM